MSKATSLVAALRHLSDRVLGDWEGNAAAKQMRAEVKRLQAGAEALLKVQVNRSPLDTPAAHTKKVADMARKFDREVTAAIQRSADAYRNGWNDAQRRIDEKINLKPDAFAQEIRATFRTMSRTNQLQLLGKLVEENRGPELAAIVKAPSILSGISDDERARYEKAIIGRHAPAELDEMARMEKAFEGVGTAVAAAGDFVKAMTDPAELARIENGEAAANEAGASFEQALSSE